MGLEYFRRGVGTVGGVQLPTQAVSATGTVINNLGVSFVTPATGANRTFRLAAPVVAGQAKWVAFDMPAASTFDIALRTESTAHTFWGTTMQTLTLSTGSDGANTVIFLQFVSQSNTAWAVASRSTGLTLT